MDGDGDDLVGGAIAGDRGEAVSERLAGTEMLDRGQAVVGRIGPRAVGREREGAEAIAAGRAGLHREIGLAGIDVGRAEEPTAGHQALAYLEGRLLLARAHAADRRHIVGAVDGDGDFFFFNDTATTEIYALSLHDALPILLDRGQAVVGRIGPRAVGREREGAEAIAAGRAGLHREIGLAGIDVG